VFFSVFFLQKKNAKGVAKSKAATEAQLIKLKLKQKAKPKPNTGTTNYLESN